MNNERQIRGRAVVYDTTAMGRGSGFSYDANLYWPGDGWWAHKEGYNVLYGDHSVKWYSDPQQHIMYWQTGGPHPNGGLSGERSSMNVPAVAYNKQPGTPGRDPGGITFMNHMTTFDCWKIVPHEFDQLAGIDEGLDDDSDF